jgi:hypothetical protein
MRGGELMSTKGLGGFFGKGFDTLFLLLIIIIIFFAFDID